MSKIEIEQPVLIEWTELAKWRFTPTKVYDIRDNSLDLEGLDYTSHLIAIDDQVSSNSMLHCLTTLQLLTTSSSLSYITDKLDKLNLVYDVTYLEQDTEIIDDQGYGAKVVKYHNQWYWLERN